MNKAMDSRAMIEGLRSEVQEQQRRTGALGVLPLGDLEQRPGPRAWSALEIAEHLNILSGHYVSRLSRAYSGAKVTSSGTFIPGHWGEKLTTAMRPLEDGTIPGPMRTLWFFEPKAARAKGMQSLLDLQALLDEQAVLLEKAMVQGMEGPRITSTLGPVLRFKIGDAFRFMIAHQQRHFLQIERALQGVVEKSAPSPVAKMPQNPSPTASPLI